MSLLLKHSTLLMSSISINALLCVDTTHDDSKKNKRCYYCLCAACVVVVVYVVVVVVVFSFAEKKRGVKTFNASLPIDAHPKP